MMPFVGCKLLMGLIHCNGHYVLWLIGCFSLFSLLSFDDDVCIFLMAPFPSFSWQLNFFILSFLQSNGWLFVYSYQHLRVTSH